MLKLRACRLPPSGRLPLLLSFAPPHNATEHIASSAPVRLLFEARRAAASFVCIARRRTTTRAFRVPGLCAAHMRVMASRRKSGARRARNRLPFASAARAPKLHTRTRLRGELSLSFDDVGGRFSGRRKYFSSADVAGVLLRGRPTMRAGKYATTVVMWKMCGNRKEATETRQPKRVNQNFAGRKRSSGPRKAPSGQTEFRRTHGQPQRSTQSISHFRIGARFKQGHLSGPTPIRADTCQKVGQFQIFERDFCRVALGPKRWTFALRLRLRALVCSFEILIRSASSSCRVRLL